MSSKVPVSENGKSFQKRQSIDEEASSGTQHFTGDQGSSSKRMKSPTTYRISDLPDGVVQDILSHLSAPEVVRTSILSPQWCELWTAVPCLQAENASEFEDDEDKFIDFVSCLLEGRSDKAPLKVLNICSAHSEDVEYWISYAMTHSVESLQFYDNRGFHPFTLDTSINFSSSHLKILALRNVSLAATHLSQLDDHCPNLRILKLEGGDLDTFGISSSSLMSLSIKYCTTPGDMLISAPNLTLLRFINSGNGVVTLEKLPSLVEASVVVDFNVDSADDENLSIVEYYKYSILRGLSHSKNLELNVPIREPLVSWKELFGGQLFSNLTTLVLEEWCMADLYPVTWFLQQAPLLENLHVTLRKPTLVEYEPRIFPKERPLRAACLNKPTSVCIPTDPMVQELVKMLRSAAKASLEIKIKEIYRQRKLAD